MPSAATLYYDIVSPYAYLPLAEIDRLPPDIAVTPKPVLLAALLNHWETKGPAEIPPKRLHTYRQCMWLANARGIPLRFPPQHPFNPLAALRLLCALGPTLEHVRIASGFVFHHGNDPSTPEGLALLGKALSVNEPASLASETSAKNKLRTNSDEALARGIWGVPTFDVRGELFWGDDSFPMMLDFLQNPELFATMEMKRLAALPVGASRR